MALQLNVDYHLFWTLNPKKLQPFITANQEQKKQKMEHANFKAWLNGIYTTYSIAAVMGENSKYPEKPLHLFSEKDDLDQRKEQESQMFSAYAAMFNKRFDENEE